MPNHIRLLLALMTAGVNPHPAEGARFGIPDVMRIFKSQTARQWNQCRGTQGYPLWQASYHNRIIRDENDLLSHQSYTKHDPAHWAEGEYHI